MKTALVLILASLIVFGCLGLGGTTQTLTPVGGSGTPATHAPQPPSGGGEACTPAYSFSELADGVLSDESDFVATVTCAAGRSIVVKLDGVEAARASAQTNATSPLQMSIAPKKDGKLKLTVESDGTTVLSKDWTVAPLGSSDTKGLEYDSVSFKEWRAIGFTVGSPITVAKVRMFVKRIASQTQPGTNLLVEIYGDSGGKPGQAIASVRSPITVTTLSDNCVTFAFDQMPQLTPGRYWVVLKVEQSEEVSLVSDSVNLHYVTVDRQSPGNDYTRQMLLSVDDRTGMASETSWTPLSYDRVYAVTVHGAG
ncbi:MAG: hypothetical protein PHV13_04460 [Candidatus ainarchaeum sp.]|nr:hypothetical protein [Candidatus ainarchaeum sp.]